MTYKPDIKAWKGTNTSCYLLRSNSF